MTTYGVNQVTCSVCGTSSKQGILLSTNRFGSPDLDLRPPEMERSTMSVWLQECPNCGFVSDNLARAEEDAKKILSTEHVASLHRGGSLIRRCLKRSLLDEGLGKKEASAEHALWAAWAADDAEDTAAAEYRSRAADLFLAAASDLPPESAEFTTMRTRTVDILRRARRWQEAADVADALLVSDHLDPTIRSVVEFGRRLARRHDSSLHTVEEALSD